MICACDNCHYLFDAPELPEQCPDCGKWETRLATKDEQSEFVERFPELSLFFKAYSLLDSEMICIFPYLCPYAESAREIREIFS